MKVNVNDKVRFTITEHGCEVLREMYEEISVPMPTHYVPGAVCEMHLHEFMLYFGNVMFPGRGGPVTENNEIEILV